MSSEKIIAAVDAELPHTFELLKALVNINSYTRNRAGVNRVQDLLANELTQLGFVCERHSFTDLGDLQIARRAGDGGKRVLLIGHTDTVFPESSGFLNYEDRGEQIVGPGVNDMKGGLVVMLAGLATLHKLNLLQGLPVTVFLNPDEEIGSPSSREYLRSECRAATAALVFEAGRDNDDIITRRRGTAIFSARVTGKAAHSGTAHQLGVNAILELSHLVPKISALTDYSQNLTVNVGTICGGTTVNTVPAEASIRFDVRVTTLDSYRKVKERLDEMARQVLNEGAEIALTEESPAVPMEETDASRALFESYRSFAAPAGLNYSTTLGMGGSDANNTAAFGVPSIDGLGPYGKLAHTFEEYALKSSFRPKIVNLALWLANKNALISRD